MLLAHPPVGVLDGVHYRDRTAGLDDSGHLREHRQGVVGVVDSPQGDVTVRGATIEARVHAEARTPACPRAAPCTSRSDTGVNASDG